MHRGFQLKLSIDELIYQEYQGLLKHGLKRYDRQKAKTEESLKNFLHPTSGKIDGSKLQEDWFPNLQSDIFLSHSHRDKDLAIALSECLYQNFGLNVFIDSYIWGYSEDLLKIIDNTYCLNSDERSYNYSKRNYSTSHVHMMLSTALTMMIDKCECIFFLNTPNSISSNSVINKTESPWIYSELTTSRLIRKKPLTEYRMPVLTEMYSEGTEIKKGLDFEYKVDINHLASLNIDDLARWVDDWKFTGNKYSPNHKEHVLDRLYSLPSRHSTNFRK